MPADEHFAEVDSDDDETTSLTTNTETSGSVTPALKIKKEKLDAEYGDSISAEKDPISGGTLQDLIRNIKKEPGVHSPEKLAAAIRTHNPEKKVKKAINPLALGNKKKKKKSKERQQLILRIKKERTEKDFPTSTNEVPETTKKDSETTKDSPIRKSLNPFAAAAAKKFRISGKLALKIKKERAKKKNKPANPESESSNIVPSIRIKREKPDSDEEHHEGPIETDYLGINPLSLLRQKNAEKKQKVSENGDSNSVECTAATAIEESSSQEKVTDKVESSANIENIEKPPETSNIVPNPMASIFGAKKTGFMKLSLNSTGLDFGSSATSRSSPVQIPVIANIVSGVAASFSDMDTDLEKSQVTSSQEGDMTKPLEGSVGDKIEDVVVNSSDPQTQTKETSLKELTQNVTKETPAEVAPVINKPKLGGFMKISGTTGGFLQFPGELLICIYYKIF